MNIICHDKDKKIECTSEALTLDNNKYPLFQAALRRNSRLIQNEMEAFDRKKCKVIARKIRAFPDFFDRCPVIKAIRGPSISFLTTERR